MADDTSSPIPDPAIVKEYCDKMGCKATCAKTSTNSCIRYAHYTGEHLSSVTEYYLLFRVNLGINPQITSKLTKIFLYLSFLGGAPQNITYFCGAVQDTTDDVTLKEGLVTDTLTGGIIVNVKYCQGSLCNSGNHINSYFFFMLMSFVAIFLLR